MIWFKKKTDKEIQEEIERETKRYKKEEHTEQLQSQLKAIKTSQKHLKHERFQRKYGGLIKGLKIAEEETIKGIKFAGKAYTQYEKSQKPKKRYKAKTVKRKSRVKDFWSI